MAWARCEKLKRPAATPFQLHFMEQVETIKRFPSQLRLILTKDMNERHRQAIPTDQLNGMAAPECSCVYPEYNKQFAMPTGLFQTSYL